MTVVEINRSGQGSRVRGVMQSLSGLRRAAPRTCRSYRVPKRSGHGRRKFRRPGAAGARAEAMAVRPGISASIPAGSSMKWRQPRQVAPDIVA